MIHFKEQERFVEMPSLREFYPFKFFIEFVNFDKFRGTSDNTPSFDFDFSIPLHCCCVQVSHRISAYCNKEQYKQSR